MRRCGLDKQTLAVPEKWCPGPVEPTAASFLNFYRMATTRAAPKLSADGDASGITAAPGRLVEAEAAFQAALDKATEATRLVTVEAAKTTPVELDTAAKSVLASVRLRATDQARAFKPAAEDRKPHVEMGKYVDALAALSERRLTAISRVADRCPVPARRGTDRHRRYQPPVSEQFPGRSA